MGATSIATFLLNSLKVNYKNTIYKDIKIKQKYNYYKIQQCYINYLTEMLNCSLLLRIWKIPNTYGKIIKQIKRNYFKIILNFTIFVSLYINIVTISS